MSEETIDDGATFSTDEAPTMLGEGDATIATPAIQPLLDRPTAMFEYVPVARGRLTRQSTPPDSKELGAGTFKLGRASECDWVLDTVGVSRVHATIRTVEGAFVLSAATSKNGVLVNGSLESGSRTLRSGDVIQICGESFTFEDLQAPSRSTELPKGLVSEPVEAAVAKHARRQESQIPKFVGGAVLAVIAFSASNPWVVASISSKVAPPPAQIAPTAPAPVGAKDPLVMPAILKTQATQVVARNTGKVRQVRVAIGDVVEAGKVIIEMATPDLDRRIGDLRNDLSFAEKTGATATKQKISGEIAALEAKRRNAFYAAPVVGSVREVAVVVGQEVETGASLAEIVDLSEGLLEVEVPDSEAGAIVPGSKVVVRFGASIETAGEVTLVRPGAAAGSSAGVGSVARVAVVAVRSLQLEHVGLPASVVLYR